MAEYKQKKVLTISLQKLLRDEWFQFMTDYKERIEGAGTENLKIPLPMWEKFLKWYDVANKSIRPIEESVITPVLVQIDDKRTKLFTGLKKFVASFLTYTDEPKKLAAINVFNICHAYKDVPKDDYRAKTSAIYNFIKELQSNYAAEIETLDINVRLEELGKANEKFEQKWFQRNEEMATGKKNIDFLKVRNELDWYYVLTTWTLEADLETEENAAVKMFVFKWNVVVKTYKTLIARRN